MFDWMCLIAGAIGWIYILNYVFRLSIPVNPLSIVVSTIILVVVSIVLKCCEEAAKE